MAEELSPAPPYIFFSISTTQCGLNARLFSDKDFVKTKKVSGLHFDGFGFDCLNVDQNKAINLVTQITLTSG